MYALLERLHTKKIFIAGACTLACAGVLFLCAMFFGVTVHAATPNALQNLNTSGAQTGLGGTDVRIIAARIMRVFFGLLGIIAISILVYAGYLWMMARGDETQIEKAKDILKNGIIGLVIILSSYAITEFIFSKLLAATGAGEIAGYGSDQTSADLANYLGYAQLGKVVQSTDPYRDQTGVPRNTNIQVVFKFPIDLGSVADLSASGVVKKGDVVIAAPLRADNISIYPTDKGKDAALKTTDVMVYPVYENGATRAFVFDPQPLLGSDVTETKYTVALLPGIQKASPNLSSAFSGFSGGYAWNFIVSTQVDLTPPHVVSVTPVAGGTFDRNITIQVTFSKPLNLASAVGNYPSTDGNFVNITARTSADIKDVIGGSWRAGPGFNVLEFTPADSCGKNSCGINVFCLPPSAQIYVRALAGPLQDKGKSPQAYVADGFQGIVDDVNNALDGGGENAAKPWSLNGGTPQGSPDDDFYMQFATTNNKKITAPQVTAVTPTYDATAQDTPPVEASSSVGVDFDSLMKVTTFDGVALQAKNPLAQSGYWQETTNKTNAQNNSFTALTFQHVPFALKQDYGTIIPSSVLDVYQNCFLPASAPALGCSPTQQDPNAPNATTNQKKLYCCNGVPRATACDEQAFGTQ